MVAPVIYSIFATIVDVIIIATAQASEQAGSRHGEGAKRSERSNIMNNQ
jgi:hypothetical protein